MNKPEKTVFILGSGFSSPAGGLSQEAILKEIFNLKKIDKKTSKYRKTLKDFLSNTLNVDQNKASLEDIYTPIDRCLADDNFLRDKSQSELLELREQIGYLISYVIKRKLEDGSKDQKYANDFANYLVSLASIRAQKAKSQTFSNEAKKYDPFSIISLNWDILLDNALFETLKERNIDLIGDYVPFGVVDYCCYISSIEQNENHIQPGLWALGCRGYNVKLLKLHGSMNWLQCPNCQRLFVGFGEKFIVSNFIEPKNCRHCEKYGYKINLGGSLVMPTFLKDLSNFQIKLIWQNAGVELMEANRIIFIGYSLPHADFEFRQLLSRMIRKDVEIRVVLFNDGTRKGMRDFAEAKNRYTQFFSKHSPNITSEGVVSFIKNYINLT